MRLGIISDCVHVQHSDGRIGTETHILLYQLEALAVYFDEVLVACPFISFNENKVATFYTDKKFSFIHLPNVGGNNWIDKLRLLQTIPKWWSAFKKIDKSSDIVYQRFPNNLNLPGFFYFYFNHKKVFATYTGTWENYLNEPFTYRLQKWLLKKCFRGTVWAYLDKPSDNVKIRKGFSPSYSKKVWDEETEQVNKRIEKLKLEGLQKLKLISVGAFVPNKNQQFILDACLQLQQLNISFQLTLVGDGYLKDEYQKFLDKHQLNTSIIIAGKKTTSELIKLYREHDFIIQAPIREGFGKVPIEGFFHGLVPILSDVGLAKAIAEDNRGFTFSLRNQKSLSDLLENLSNKSALLPYMILNGRAFAASQTLEAWAAEYASVILV